MEPESIRTITPPRGSHVRTLLCPRRQHDPAAGPDHRRQPSRHRRAAWRPRRPRRPLAAATAPPTASFGTPPPPPPAPCSPSASSRATASASGRRNRFEWVVLQYATARVGAILVNVNPAYLAGELEYVLRQSGVSVLFHGRRLPPERLRSHARTGSSPLPRSARHARTSTTTGTPSWPAATPCPHADLDARRGGAAIRRPDQHPVHLRHDRLAQGRDADAPQHPQQRLLRRRAAWATPRPTACASRSRFIIVSAWSWATSPARRTAPAWWSPANVSSPPPCWKPSRPSAARRCTACRPCSAPSSKTRPSRPPTAPRCAPASWPVPRARSN